LNKLGTDSPSVFPIFFFFRTRRRGEEAGNAILREEERQNKGIYSRLVPHASGLDLSI
jgi:hypothetical protein